MVDYDFYVNTYLGSTIPEKAFPGMAARAGAALERFQRIYAVVQNGEDSRNMALCAMAESIYANQRRSSGVTSASVGNVAVRYEHSESTDKALWRELYQKAGIYLDIYRGVSQ